jgi:hypothetical protein
MGRWYQVFDDERVNLVTRSAARRHAGAATALGLVSGIALFASVVGPLSIYPVVLTLVGLWGWAGAALFRFWTDLRRQVWCLKISDREVVGYDYRRKRIRIDWVDALGVDVNNRGLSIAATKDRRLEVPVRFPSYTDLCHTVLEHAEFYGVPVLVDGAPLAAVAAKDVFPFLGEFDPDE